MSNTPEEVAQDQLRSFVERIERLEEEKATIAMDIKDVYSEAKGQGHNVKALRKFVARRKRDRDELAEEDALLEIYEGIFG